MVNSSSIPASPSRILLASIGIAAAILAYYRLMWPTFREFQLAVDFTDIPFCDFVVFYYPMGQEVFLTNIPVVGYQYSHFFALILHLFAILPLPVSTAVWVLLLVGTTILLTWVSFRIVYPSQIKYFPLFLGLVLSSFPILHNFVWGQVGVLCTLLILAALHFSMRKKDVAAGMLLAAAVSLKYYPAVFLIPFVAGFNKRVLFAFFIACLAFLVVIPAMVVGGEQTFQFLGSLMKGAYSKQLSAGGENSQNLVNVFTRWLTYFGHESQTTRFILRTMSYLCVEGVIILIVLMVRYSVPRTTVWAFVLLSLSIPLFVATSWPHYLVYLPFCQLFLFRQLREDGDGSHGHRRLHLALLFISVFLASIVALNLTGDWKLYNGAGLLFLSNMLLLAISVRLTLPHLLHVVSERRAAKPATMTIRG